MAPPRPREPIRLASPAYGSPATTPFAEASPGALQVASEALLVQLSRHLEAQADQMAAPSVVLSTVQDAVHCTPQTAARYESLAERSPLVALLGRDVSRLAGPRVHWTDLDPLDPVVHEWDVLVVGPHYAAALLARDLGDPAQPDVERRFSYQVTHGRDTVVRAARALLRRVVPMPARPVPAPRPAAHV